MNYLKQQKKTKKNKIKTYYLLKNKGKQKQKLSEIDRITLKYISETKCIKMYALAKATEDNKLSELLQQVRNSTTFSIWNLSNALKTVFKPIEQDINFLAKGIGNKINSNK